MLKGDGGGRQEGTKRGEGGGKVNYKREERGQLERRQHSGR